MPDNKGNFEELSMEDCVLFFFPFFNTSSLVFSVILSPLLPTFELFPLLPKNRLICLIVLSHNFSENLNRTPSDNLNLKEVRTCLKKGVREYLVKVGNDDTVQIGKEFLGKVGKE